MGLRRLATLQNWSWPIPEQAIANLASGTVIKGKSSVYTYHITTGSLPMSAAWNKSPRSRAPLSVSHPRTARYQESGNYLPIPRVGCSPPETFWHPSNTGLHWGMLRVRTPLMGFMLFLARMLLQYSLNYSYYSSVYCIKKYSFLILAQLPCESAAGSN